VFDKNRFVFEIPVDNNSQELEFFLQSENGLKVWKSFENNFSFTVAKLKSKDCTCLISAVFGL